jgi:hypothetical protein
MIDAFALIEHALNGEWQTISATRYFLGNWETRVVGTNFGRMQDWGFTDNKMKYLERKYPLDALPPDGCLARVGHRTLTYNRVDLARGLAADLIYLNAQGRTVTRIRAPLVKLHTVSLSAVLPALIAEGYHDFRLKNDGLRKSLRREVENRYMRRHEAKRDTTRRLNNWAHSIGGKHCFERAMDWLEAQ